MSVKKDANASVENRRKSFDFEDDVTHDEFVEVRTNFNSLFLISLIIELRFLILFPYYKFNEYIYNINSSYNRKIKVISKVEESFLLMSFTSFMSFM